MEMLFFEKLLDQSQQMIFIIIRDQLNFDHILPLLRRYQAIAAISIVLLFIQKYLPYLLIVLLKKLCLLLDKVIFSFHTQANLFQTFLFIDSVKH